MVGKSTDPARAEEEMMSTLDDWFDVYEEAYAAVPHDADLACPNCGHHTLRLVFTADPGRDVGNGAFWCDTCLLGISISRAVIPDGATVRDRGLPREERLPKIPDFRLVR
jgi:hypothetical protein